MRGRRGQRLRKRNNQTLFTRQEMRLSSTYTEGTRAKQRKEIKIYALILSLKCLIFTLF